MLIDVFKVSKRSQNWFMGNCYLKKRPKTIISQNINAARLENILTKNLWVYLKKKALLCNKNTWKYLNAFLDTFFFFTVVGQLLRKYFKGITDIKSKNLKYFNCFCFFLSCFVGVIRNTNIRVGFAALAVFVGYKGFQEQKPTDRVLKGQRFRESRLVVLPEYQGFGIGKIKILALCFFFFKKMFFFLSLVQE